MEAGSAVLIVRGFAVREGRNKWACCYEIRLASACDAPLIHRGELHGRAFVSEDAAVVAAREAGECEARRRIAAGLASSFLSDASSVRAADGEPPAASIAPVPSHADSGHDGKQVQASKQQARRKAARQRLRQRQHGAPASPAPMETDQADGSEGQSVRQAREASEVREER